MRNTPLVEMRDIYKWFGEVHAVDGIDLKVEHGEIVGLVGDNGAGKSTLIKCLSGYYRPDKGKIFWKGQKVEIKNPTMARKRGIMTVYQDQALVASMDISRNIFMGRELVGHLGFLDIKKMNEESMKVLEKVGLTSIKSPNMLVQILSGGERGGVAISRAIYFKAELVILDEPTMGLSVKEVKRVLELVKKLKEEGISIIFITHNLYHAYPVSDRFVVLRRGKVMQTVQKKDTTVDKLGEAISK